MSVNFQGNSELSNILNELQNVGQRGGYSEAPKLPKPKPQTALRAFKGLSWDASPGGGVTGGTGLPGGSLGSLMNAIRSQESGGNYRAVNPHSGAMGGYQIMPFNLSSWSQGALGRNVSRNEFMSSPAIQDAIARWQLGNYLKKYGAAGAAVAWYGGPGAVKNMYSKTTQAHGYPSLYAYWQSVLSKM